MTLIDKAEALLPCPFCGGKARAIHKQNYSGGTFASAECTSCVAEISIPYSNMTYGEEEMRQVISAWNRRALPARGVGAPEAMRQMIVQAVAFANRAAGEGICIDDLEPETFLFDYSQATGDEDWETLPARILATLSPTTAADPGDDVSPASAPVTTPLTGAAAAAVAPTDAPHVNETPKSEHDAGNVLTAAQAREAALADRITEALVASQERAHRAYEQDAPFDPNEHKVRISAKDAYTILALISEART